MRKIAQRATRTKGHLLAASLMLGLSLGGCRGPRLTLVPSGPQLLSVQGQVAGGPFALGRADLSRLPRAAFEAVDPAAGRRARFEGVPLGPLLTDRIERRPGADTAVFETSDGLRLALPVAALEAQRALLADRIDGGEATLQLAWPNLEQPGLDRDPRGELRWAHQIVSIELIRWEASWGPALAAPLGASDAARRGAGQLLLRCAPCHAVAGVGGRRGPPLDGAPARLGPVRFEAAVRDHPGWSDRVGPELTPDGEVLAELQAFLAAAPHAAR